MEWSAAQGESRASQDAVDEPRPVLDLAQFPADGGDQVFRVGERHLRQVPADQWPDFLDRVELWGAGGKLDDGQLVMLGHVLLHPSGQVSVQVVPDEHDRSELGVCHADQVPVVGPGEALAAIGAVVRCRTEDQARTFAGFVAGQRGHRQATSGAAADPDDRGASAVGPGAGGRRRHREPGLVFEDQPGPERRLGVSTLGQVSLIQPMIAASSRSTARRAGT